MSTPFICRQCIARLSQSPAGRSKPRRVQIHTQASSTSVWQPIWAFSEEQRAKPLARHDVTTDHGIKTPAANPLLDSKKSLDEPAEKQKIPWDGQIKKFIPRQRAEVSKVAREKATTPRELKAKILRALGDYDIVFKDLRRVYKLSDREARRAVDQLKRLLWGRDSLDEAASRLDQFHLWKRGFKDLLQPSAPSNESAIFPKIAAWKQDFKQDIATMKDVWHRGSQKERESTWPHLVKSAFQSKPGAVPTLLMATFHSSWCPSYVVEDIVYLLFQASDGVQDTAKISELVFFLLENCPPRYLVLEQMVIWKLTQLVRTSELLRLYEALQRVEHPLRPNTLLHFASRFARESDYKGQAAEILRRLSSMPGFDINSPAAASVCTTLLNVKKDDKLPVDQAAPDELFKVLLEAGFQPNLFSLSALMRNFCVRGHFETAWNILSTLVQRGIKPDAHVFSILLNGSKLILDANSLQSTAGMIDSHEAWSSVLANDPLDFIYKHNEAHTEWRRRQRKQNSARAWRLIVQIYAKFFVFAPLQKLTLFPLENVFGPLRGPQRPHMMAMERLVASVKARPEAMLLQPDSATLALVFKAHIRSINNPKRLLRYHDHFMDLLRKRDPVAVRLVREQGTTIQDTLIRALMQYGTGLESGLRIVEQMRTSAQKLDRDVLHPPPSAYTYTGLISSLRNHRQPHGVVTALNMMVDAGHQPSTVAWNAVISALLQAPSGPAHHDAVRVMRHLEQTGQGSTPRTVREITRLSLSKRRRVAFLMQTITHNPAKYADPRVFARSLLKPWDGSRADGEKANRTRLSMRRSGVRGFGRRSLDDGIRGLEPGLGSREVGEMEVEDRR
ncbi:hypothetical protein GGR54DRAFT_594183 [Hypoxylon sp. NC1633]|nr:hypothetical protein GGR54DRAFT_594183 [Hypoxylon sp. NC1633]